MWGMPYARRARAHDIRRETERAAEHDAGLPAVTAAQDGKAAISG
jgi:hypothetical protein